MYYPKGIFLASTTYHLLNFNFDIVSFKDFNFLLTEEGFEVQKLLFDRVCTVMANECVANNKHILFQKTPLIRNGMFNLSKVKKNTRHLNLKS